MGRPIDAKILLDSLRQMANFTSTCVLSATEQQSDLTMRTAETLLEAAASERAAMEATAKQLHENAMQSIAVSTRLAEASANRFEALEARVVMLERELARTRPARASGDDEGSGP